MDINTMITTYNTAVTDAASGIHVKGRSRKKPRVTRDVLNLCDERRDLKKKRYKAEYCSELYSHESLGDDIVPNCSQPLEENLKSILPEEVDISVALLKRGKYAGVDNILTELVVAGGETMIDVLTEICELLASSVIRAKPC